MDNLGVSTPPIVIRTAPSIPQLAPAAKPEAPVLPIGGSDTAAFDLQAAEAQRLQAITKAAQSVADIFVVSDRTFTIFKDVSGQYITRFTSLRDGKVTYIPEPNLFRLGGESDSSSLRIKV